MIHFLHNSLSWRTTVVRCAAAATLAVLAAVALVAWRVGVFDGNVHVVAPGRVYRSAQLSTEELRGLVVANGIRCVLNLRRASDPTPEYAAERTLCAELGVEFVGLPFSPSKLPEPQTVVALIDQFRRGPYPLLIHCEHGADRTGLASVVYDLVVAEEDLDHALRADLSWRTGHVGLGRERAMDRFFDLFRDTRGARDFETWAREVYPSVYSDAVRAKPRQKPGAPAKPIAASALDAGVAPAHGARSYGESPPFRLDEPGDVPSPSPGRDAPFHGVGALRHSHSSAGPWQTLAPRTPWNARSSRSVCRSRSLVRRRSPRSLRTRRARHGSRRALCRARRRRTSRPSSRSARVPRPLRPARPVLPARPSPRSSAR